MTQNDDVPSYHTEHVCPERHRNLLNDALGRDKSCAALSNRCRHEVPEDESRGQEWQELRNLLAEEIGINEAQSANQHAHGEGEPERSHDGAPIALPDIVEAER